MRQDDDRKGATWMSKSLDVSVEICALPGCYDLCISRKVHPQL